jgi:hypothetical protein
MKSKKKIFFVTVICIFIFVLSVITILFVNINKRLEEYHINDINAVDVIAVDLGIKDYIKISNKNGADFVLAKENWNFENYFEDEIKFVEQYGTDYEYIMDNGKSVWFEKTDEWCIFFRIYKIWTIDN